MKNVLNYYYNLYPTSIHQINDSYKCYLGDEEYLLLPYSNDIQIINKIYELNKYLLRYNIPCHKIVQNVNNEIVTLINNVSYILLRIFVNNRSIITDDILFFSTVYIDDKYFIELKKDDWYDMWIKKIDYFEYQVSQFGIRFPVIRNSINYYIGMAENSISLLNGVKINMQSKKVICHKRIKMQDGLAELYNPLNFIVDNRTRNLSEYIKEKFFFSKYTIQEAINDINRFNFNKEEYFMLFARMMFPSYYFDYYEQVLQDKRDENDLKKIISKNEQYLTFLKDIYCFIKQYTDLPEIEWLIKT